MLKEKDIQLWIVHKNPKLMPVTNDEKRFASKLSFSRSNEYLFTRGCLRKILSEKFRIPPLDIPLEAPPGMPPIIDNNLGYISISHCKNALFLGWCKEKIGIDIEQRNRLIPAKKIYQRFYTEREKSELLSLASEKLRLKTLRFWILKEASIKWEYGSLLSGLSDWEVSHNLKESFNKTKNITLNSYCLDFASWCLGVVNKSTKLELNKIEEIF